MCIHCHNARQTGENNPNWKGGRSTDRVRYKQIQHERYPERVRARWVIETGVRRGVIQNVITSYSIHYTKLYEQALLADCNFYRDREQVLRCDRKGPEDDGEG